jgi:TonB C terminal
MWLLQHKNTHKRRQNLLWLKIIGLCCILHLLLLLWVFCIYHDKTYMLTFAVSKNVDYSIPVVFSVRPQTTTQKNSTTTACAHTPIIAKAKPSAPAITKQTATSTPKNAPAKASVQKAVAQPVAANTTTIASAKNEIKEASLDTSSFVKTTSDVKKPKIETKPIIATTETKKAEAKPTPEMKKEEVTSSSVETTADVKKDVIKEEKRTIETNKEENTFAKAIDIQQDIKPITMGSPCAEKRNMGLENAHISSNFREVEALRRGAQLQKELVQKWQPPIGVAPDCSCELSFSVSKNGTVQQLKTTKTSGVLMFDISARQALCAMKMPQWTYGKPLIISFLAQPTLSFQSGAH